MASSAEIRDEQALSPELPRAAGVPFFSLLLAVLAAVVLAVSLAGGGVYWLFRSGHLALPGTAPKVGKASEPTPPPKTHSVAFEPLLVNLADEGGSAYLRLSLSLRVLDEAPLKGEKPKEEKPEKGKAVVNESEAAVRDVALDVIGRTTAVELLQVDGKEKLKQQLLAAMDKRVPEVKVKDIFFTEFLVQQ